MRERNLVREAGLARGYLSRCSIKNNSTADKCSGNWVEGSHLSGRGSDVYSHSLYCLVMSTLGYLNAMI